MDLSLHIVASLKPMGRRLQIAGSELARDFDHGIARKRASTIAGWKPAPRPAISARLRSGFRFQLFRFLLRCPCHDQTQPHVRDRPSPGRYGRQDARADSFSDTSTRIPSS